MSDDAKVVERQLDDIATILPVAIERALDDLIHDFKKAAVRDGIAGQLAFLKAFVSRPQKSP